MTKLLLFSVAVSGPDHDSGLLPRSLSVIFNSIDGRLYSRNDLKPQRCRDYSRLTPDQQAAEVSSKKNLLRPFKEVRLSHTILKCVRCVTHNFDYICTY